MAAAAQPVAVKVGGPGVLLDDCPVWRSMVEGDVDVFVAGDLSHAAVAAFCARVAAGGGSPDAVAKAATDLRGHFAIVMRGGDWTVALVDRVRSIPLIWAAEPDFTVAQVAGRLLGAADAGRFQVDADQALAVALSGYTVGAATLFTGVTPLLPGCFVVQAKGSISVHRYHRFQPWLAQSDARDEGAVRRELADLTLNILQKLVDRAGGRPIAVPLSAGLDSRLIAAGLKHLGCRNVVTFAYGRSGNHEAETSRLIAERLGYPWHFVPYSNGRLAPIFASRDYASYRQYADSLTGVHFPQDYPALTELLRDGRLPRDAVLVNGQSGDFITGNHVPAALARPGEQSLSPDARTERITAALIAKHFKQWQALKGPKAFARIAAMLGRELDDLAEATYPDDPSMDFGLYEASEFVDRQSKYVVNGQRVYEYLGLEWSLPLWHDDYIDFWERAPLAWKFGQRLYREMLLEANWADVWHDIPVNAKRIRPRWIIPLRFAAKVAHAPLGRARWHEFERKVFEPLMTPLCGYAVRRWTDIAFDRRGPQTAIAPHIEDYLQSHGIALEDVIRDWAS